MGQRITRATTLALAVEKPYLMHAVNGVAADHLCHLLPASQHPVQHRQSQLASYHHWQRAFRMFRNELANGPTRQNMDALMSTVMLTCVHQFMLAEAVPDASKSFLFAPEEKRRAELRWLQIHHGYTALQAALGRQLWTSMWNPVFLDSDVKRMSTSILTPDAGDESHKMFLELCEITPASSRKNNPYYEALQFLLVLRKLPAGGNRFNKLVVFVAVVEDKYLELLLQRDARALVILAHWLALMTEVNQWWISGRCRSECVAITTVLMHETDERIRALLKHPARTVGIVLT
jgi:hypothetical protein